MFEYKGYYYFCEEGLWKVLIGDCTFIVALDDSHSRRIIWSKNNEESCKEFIDLLDK